MKRKNFLARLKSPLPNAILQKAPAGHIMQFWGENPDLYSRVFGQSDDLHYYLAGHSGIDISTHHRDPVYAAHDGYVAGIRSDREGMGGLVVWLNSEPLDDKAKGDCRIQTAYAHLDEIVVKQNQPVKQGQLIGYEGNTGFVVSGSTAYWGNAPAGVGTHLHFSLYEHKLVTGVMWQARDLNPMQNSTDPLPFISDPTPFDAVADGNLSGWRIVLENAQRYLLSIFKK